MEGIGDLRNGGGHNEDASEMRILLIQRHWAAVPQETAKGFRYSPNLPNSLLPALASSAMLFVGRLLKKSLRRASAE